MAASIAAADISCSEQTYTFNFNGSPSAFLDMFRHYYGPTMNAFDAAEKQGRSDALAAELDTLFNQQNRSGRPDMTTIPATFLLVRVKVG